MHQYSASLFFVSITVFFDTGQRDHLISLMWLEDVRHFLGCTSPPRWQLHPWMQNRPSCLPFEVTELVSKPACQLYILLSQTLPYQISAVPFPVDMHMDNLNFLRRGSLFSLTLVPISLMWLEDSNVSFLFDAICIRRLALTSNRSANSEFGLCENMAKYFEITTANHTVWGIRF